MDTTITVAIPVEDRLRNEGIADVQALSLLWSRDEPERVGEIVLLPSGPTTAAIGRQPGTSLDPIARLSFRRQYPGRNESMGPFKSPTISREQLRFEIDKAGAVTVENVGRGRMLHNGVLNKSATLQLGDMIEIEQRVLLLFTLRPFLIAGSSQPGQPLPSHPFGGPDKHGMVGESPVSWALRDRVYFAGGRTTHLLIRGESGTGKELVAQALHAVSPRARRHIISRNAATIPESIADAELFGNAKNYPNPGTAERPGLIGASDGGTLFLDEFAEIPVDLQARLLRVLDSGEYHRLGESKARRADFRLIAATNRPDSYVKQDVLARLKMRIDVPTLNDRREDIPLITRFLLQRIAKNDEILAERFFPNGDPRQSPRISPALIAALVRHDYTTHIRELEASLWQAMTIAKGDTLEYWDHFGVGNTSGTHPALRITRPSSRLSRVVERSVAVPSNQPPGGFADPNELTSEQVQAVLDKHDGAQEPTWRELGLSSRHVLGRLVKRFGLQVSGRGGKRVRKKKSD